MVYGLSLAGIAYLELQTGSSAGTGLVILSSILPAFLASLIAGAVVDRFGRRPTLLVSHFARALLAIGFWAGTHFLSPAVALAAIALVNVGTAAFGQFAFPAELSLVPDLVPRERVPRANAILQFGMLLGEGLGIIFLAPFLIRLWGVPAVGLSGALLCLTAMLLVFGLPRDDVQRPPALSTATGSLSTAKGSLSTGTGSLSTAKGTMPKGTGAGSPQPDRTLPPQGDENDAGRKRLTWADLKAGWKTIAGDPVLRLVVLQLTVGATLLLVLLSLVPGLATRYLDVAVVDAPFLVLPGGLAFVLAATVVSRVQRGGERRQVWLPPPAWIAIGLLVVGFGTVLLGVTAVLEPGIGLALLGITAIGLGLGAVVIPGRVVLQQRPPRELRARVIAGQLTMANAAAVIPLLVGGTLADRLGLGPVIIVLGVLAAAAGLAGARHIHRSQNTFTLPPSAPPAKDGTGPAHHDRAGDPLHREGDPREHREG
jgi:MFS family permease